MNAPSRTAAGRAQAERVSRCPAVLLDLDDGVDRQHQPRGDQERPDDVGSGAEAETAVGGQHGHGDGEGREPDRQVDEEDPVPAEGVGEDPAEDLADRRTGRTGEAEHGYGAGAFPGLGEECHEDAQADGGRHRAADALQEPGGDEQRGRGGEARQQ